MPETLYKLQPNRTMHLRGFDHFGAAAAMHSAHAGGFQLSGVFRDAADFAVLMLYDADNFFEHPRLKYLPDFNFDGLTLQFDVRYEGLMPLDSRKYPTIDWPFLDIIPETGDPVKIRLSEHAVLIGDPDPVASGEFVFTGDELDAWDRVTLWYQNLAFDYIVPGKVRTVHEFYAADVGTQHSILVADRSYVYVEQAGDGSADVANHLIALVNGTEGPGPADPDVSAASGEQGWQVVLERKLDHGGTVTVSGTGGVYELLHHVKKSTVLNALRDQINTADYEEAATPFSLAAEVTEQGALRISTVEGGYDADFLTLYATWKNDRLRTTKKAVALEGGFSEATHRVTLDFASLGVPRIRKMWLTFAPRLSGGAPYESTEWLAEFTRWQTTGPEEVRRLKVASTGSVRVSSISDACNWQGDWRDIDGFYMDNAARLAETPGTSVTIRYTCLSPHELWLGTALGRTSGAADAELDGTPLPYHMGYLAEDVDVVTRRRLCGLVEPGEHVVKLTRTAGRFVFDFLEAAVPGDVPDPLPPEPRVSPALDYSTDHSYKLPPARILWNLDQLGYTGPMNEYLGVFWWNERVRDGGSAPWRELEFTGGFVGGDAVWLQIDEQVLGKTVFPGETAEGIANHFMYMINSTLVGLRAEADENKLKLISRSAAPAYGGYQISSWVDRTGGSSGWVEGSGSVSAGDMGVWVLDAGTEHALNIAARQWHFDLFSQAAQRGRRLTAAISMELVNPPQEFAARYPDGAPVVTDVGFAGLRSTHCAFRSDVLAYQVKALVEVALLMTEAGLQPDLQCGEFTWWYFTNRSETNAAGGMAYYDSETAQAALAALGRPLHVFTGPDDDPAVNGGADALLVRNRLRDHVTSLMAGVRAAAPGTTFEVLFPYDVNYPVPKGMHQLGGRLNRFVNLPEEWAYPGGGLDRLKLEMLNFGAWSRDLDLVKECLLLPSQLGWPGEKTALMTPIFKGGYPWAREVEAALERGFHCINLWAFDHICLYGLSLGRLGRRASYQG
ncbi:MAG: hypothetical protein IH602_11880 [Bryobacteraceae bacterium]|nr:hypothetical protein [Bryobacteraceae bacterium]